MFRFKHLRNSTQRSHSNYNFYFELYKHLTQCSVWKACPSPTPTWNTWSMNHKMRAGDFSVASALKTTFVMLMGKMWSVINHKREKISRDYRNCQTVAVVLKYVTIESHLKHSWVWVKIQWDLKEIWVFSTEIYGQKQNRWSLPYLTV